MHRVRLTRLAALGLACLGLSAPQAMAMVPIQSYTYSYVGLDLDSDEILDIEVDEPTAGVLATLTGPGGSQGLAVSDYGLNRAYARAVNPTGGTEQIGAVSVWSDQFTVTGGGGPASAQVSVTLDGLLGAGYYAAFSYLLVQSAEPIWPWDILALLESGTLPPDLLPVIAAFGDSEFDAGTVQTVLTGQVQFEYATPFHLTSILVVGASDGGEADFDQSARFGVSLPGGASFQAASGTPYVSAVPEAESWAMLLAGLGLLGLRPRRR